MKIFKRTALSLSMTAATKASLQPRTVEALEVDKFFGMFLITANTNKSCRYWQQCGGV